MGGKKKEAKEKPLEKMTAKELREAALEIPDIVGAHGMNKDELISVIKEARGIVEEKISTSTGTIREWKQKIQALKKERQNALEKDDKRMADIYRRRINRLKRKTRRAA